MKDILAIFRRNFISPIVIAIYSLAALLLYMKEYRDAYFITVVITLNTSIAILQEVRARHVLKKLELMSAPKARRILPSGKIEEIMFNELAVGDVIQLQLGDEVPADGEIIDCSGLEIDESILTGESAPVEKQKSELAYAASSVVAGGATMRVTAVNQNTKIGAMSTVLKRYEPELTPLQSSLNRTILWFTYGAIGLALLITIIYSFDGEGIVQILKTIVSASVAVVPEGLILASTLLLAFGSIKLAQAKVLPQKLSAIEAMALLDILCVDKTGTLTSDKIKFEKIELFDDNISHAAELVGILAKETSGGSSTGEAIIEGLPAPKAYEILQTLAFSSARKMSGLKIKYKDKTYSVLMGAPEFVELLAPITALQKNRIKLLAGEGKRVLLFALFNDTKISLKDLKNNSGTAVGLIILSNELRTGVEKTVAYLQKNNVNIRVISGDSPDTVQYVASQAGIVNSDKIITGDELRNIPGKDWDSKVMETTIFARVLPEQKEKLIETFKRLGNFTGMVGDGINDALALKKSDLGVAMYSGAIATRRIADIVLLNNSFNSLPIGMKLGNQVMQAIEVIANLFFHKVIYWVLLLLVTLFVGLVYPFDPRHITFMNIFAVTFPTLMWTLFPPTPRHRISPKKFWHDTLFAVAPIALLSGATVSIAYVMLNNIHINDRDGVFTMTVLIATLFGIYMVFLSPKMFDMRASRKAWLGFLLYIIISIFVGTSSFALKIFRDFFNFTTPAWQNSWPLLLLIILVAILQWKIAVRAGNRFKNRKSQDN
jgi:cation-transporting ATPase E